MEKPTRAKEIWGEIEKRAVRDGGEYRRIIQSV
jgi:hypothetical protein